MNRSAKLALSLLAACALLSACGGGGNTRPDRPSAPQPGTTTEAPATPDKGDPEARLKQALELMKKKQLKEAETALLKLAQDFPEYGGPQTNLGILLAKAGPSRREFAVSAFSKAVTANPQNAAAWNWLGILYREGGDYARAQQAYEKALTAKPDYASAQLNLGILYDEYLKRPTEAVAHYREYQRLAGKEDLRVLAWIAAIEAANAPAPAAAESTP